MNRVVTRSGRLLGSLIAVLTLGAIGPAVAFERGPPGPAMQRPTLDDRPGASDARPPLSVPTPAETTVAPLAAGLRVFVREYRLSGNTVFSDDALAGVTAPFAGREIGAEDLTALRLALTRFYVERGYINSGAVIPDQDLVDGVVRVEIVEGRLTDVELSGNRRLGAAYLDGRLRLGAGPPLNVAALQEQFQILLAGPFIRRINGEISPGARPGEALLRARVEERSPWVLGFGLDNDITPTLGELRGVLHAAALSPTRSGDILSLDLAYGEGLRDAQVDYSLPLSPRGTTLQLFGDWSQGEIVEELLTGLDIEGETTSVGFRLDHPLLLSSHERLALSVGLDSRQSKTSLLGRGFAFSPGVEPSGDSQVTVVRVAQDWNHRSATQVVALRSTFSIGVDALGATRNPRGQPDGRFLAWLGQAQWARRLPWADSQVIFRLDGQYAADPLLPLEQFSVGGGRTVRGYGKNLLVRDHGFATSLELRVPVLRTEAGYSLLEIAPFVDAGGAWFEDRESPSPSIVPALGIGLRSNPHPKLRAELYWGHALKDVPGEGDSPQESGLYFSLAANIFD